MELKALEQERITVLSQMRSVGDLRRGSLVERYIPCGKPGCRCTKPGGKGHGPSYSLTRKVEGKTQTEYIRPEHVGQVRKQLENRRAFAELCQRFFEVNEEICRLRLTQASPADAKKNSSRRSKRRSRKRSSES